MSDADIEKGLAAQFDLALRSAGPAVVMWDDPTGEFSDETGGLGLPEGMGLLRVGASSGLFAAKCRINALGPSDRLLVYREGEGSPAWLYDVEAYSRHFCADRVSLLLDALGASDEEGMREAVSRYLAFLSKPTHLRRVCALCERYGLGLSTGRDLDLAVMAAALGRDVAPRPASIVAAFIALGIPDEGAAALTALRRTGADTRFHVMLAGCAGYDEADVSWERLVDQVLAGALVADGVGFLLDAEPADDEVAAGFCREVLDELRGRLAQEEAAALFSGAEERLGVTAAVRSAGWKSLLTTDVSESAEAAIAAGALKGACAGDDPDGLADVAEQRKNSFWYGRFRGAYECLQELCAMMKMRRDWQDGLVGTDVVAAAEVWEGYTSRLYRMDGCYRRFVKSYVSYVRGDAGAVGDALDEAAQASERLYKGWYLRELGEVWDRAAGPDYRGLGYARGVDRASGFFVNYAVPLTGGRVPGVVVISDALRYEVAVELADRLERKTQGAVELRSQQAPFPSITSCGMAALLPGGYELGEDCTIRMDGRAASGTQQRESVLRGSVPNAACVRYEDFMALGRTERQERYGKRELVYLYHNAVDAVGDGGSTEGLVFDACERAMDELVGLVSLLVRELRVQNVVVTADHGFVYTREPLGLLDSVDADEVRGDVVCVTHRRAVLARDGAASDSLLEVDMGANGAAELVGFSPRGYLRVRQSGAGDNYVHGGLSLQEVCVPVLRFRNHRRGSKAFVEHARARVGLLSMGRSLCGTHVRLEFQQLDAVGGKVLPAVYETRFEDAAGRAVSSTVELHADRRLVDGSLGTLVAAFSMFVNAATGKECWLVARRSDDGAEMLRERFMLELPSGSSALGAW